MDCRARTRAHSRVYTPSVMLISITEYVYITPRNHNSLLWPPTLGLCSSPFRSPVLPVSHSAISPFLLYHRFLFFKFYAIFLPLLTRRSGGSKFKRKMIHAFSLISARVSFVCFRGRSIAIYRIIGAGSRATSGRERKQDLWY